MILFYFFIVMYYGDKFFFVCVEIEKLEKNVEEVVMKLFEKKDKLDDLFFLKRELRLSEFSWESKIKDEYLEFWVLGLFLFIYGGWIFIDVD